MPIHLGAAEVDRAGCQLNLFSGIFIAYLTAGGFYLQLFEFSTEIIDIIVAVIIYFSAFALMVKMLIGRVQKARHEKEEAQAKGGGDA